MFEIISYNHVHRLEQMTFVSLLSTLTKCTDTHIPQLCKSQFYNRFSKMFMICKNTESWKELAVKYRASIELKILQTQLIIPQRRCLFLCLFLCFSVCLSVCKK